jgi:hypothetical protein
MLRVGAWKIKRAKQNHSAAIQLKTAIAENVCQAALIFHEKF